MTRIHVKTTGGYRFGTEDGTHHLSGEQLVNWCLCDAANPVATLAEIVGRLLEQSVPVDKWLAVCQPFDLEEVK